MSVTKAWAIFDHWFEHSGHWVYGTKGKQKAEADWSHCGIDGLPKFPGARA